MLSPPDWLDPEVVEAVAMVGAGQEGHAAGARRGLLGDELAIDQTAERVTVHLKAQAVPRACREPVNRSAGELRGPIESESTVRREPGPSDSRACRGRRSGRRSRRRRRLAARRPRRHSLSRPGRQRGCAA